MCLTYIISFFFSFRIFLSFFSAFPCVYRSKSHSVCDDIVWVCLWTSTHHSRCTFVWVWVRPSFVHFAAIHFTKLLRIHKHIPSYTFTSNTIQQYFLSLSLTHFTKCLCLVFSTYIQWKCAHSTNVCIPARRTMYIYIHS